MMKCWCGEDQHLDVLEIGRVLEGGVVPVEVAQPAAQVGVVVADGADVGFEVPHIHTARVM